MDDRSADLVKKGFIPLNGRSLDLDKYSDVYDSLLPPLYAYPSSAKEILERRARQAGKEGLKCEQIA